MLFNSYLFIFIFLPITLAGFFLLGRLERHVGALSWLVLTSLVFYGWWNPSYVLLIGTSIVVNYAVGFLLSRYESRDEPAVWLLTLGIVFNLGLLGYYKYTGFLLQNLNWLAGEDWSVGRIVLPLAISFFTFQQITYLVDAHQGKTREYSFLHYCLFVTFFPQLIAGPIVHHRQMLPQFAQPGVFKPQVENLSVGLTIFTIGLFKKTVFADGMALYANPVFAGAAAGADPSFLEAWIGATAFIFQVYFDFSGYSDMAIGLARMFGILLPLNFNSPLKARSMIDLWQRWHITLTRFLRDYVYRPLGGKSQGDLRRHANMMITMVLCGLWHGPAWTFVAFGALNGVYLIVNYLWRDLIKGLGRRRVMQRPAYRRVALVLTFCAFTTTGVLFRAQSMDAAVRILRGMAGGYGFALPAHYLTKFPALAGALQDLGWSFRSGPMLFGGLTDVALVLVVLAVVWLAPNTQEIMCRVTPYLHAPPAGKAPAPAWSVLTWRPAPAQAVVFSLVLLVAVHFIRRSSAFVYFQF